MSRWSHTLGWLVAKTDVFPLRPLYASIYSAGLKYLAGQLRPLPGLRGLYLSGSYALGQHVHGRSDIDFFIVVDTSELDSLTPLYRVLQRSITLFPFLGPLSERLNQVVQVDPQGEVDHADLLFRQRLGQLRTVLEQPGFRLRGRVPWSQLQLTFLNLQLKLAWQARQQGRVEARFWQRRCRAVAQLLEAQGQPTGFESSWPGLLQALELAAQGAVAGLVHSQLPPGMPTQAPNDPQNPQRIGSFWVGPADPARREFRSVGAVFSWQPLSLLGFAEPLQVVSRWEAPWLFDEGSLPQEIWDWNLAQAASTLQAIGKQLERGDKSLLESDWGLLQALLASAQIRSLLQGEPQPDPRSLLAWLIRRFPESSGCLEQVLDYREALERGQGRQFVAQLPANLTGYLIALTRSLIDNSEAPSRQLLERRLSLSLCVVTRDRPQWLAALLETVVAQSRLPDEVLIVDNSPVQSARAVADAFCERLPMRYLWQAQGRLGALRSLALEQSVGEIICFTDDDCLLESDWVAQAERSFLRDERIGAVGGRVRHHRQDDTALDKFHQIYLG